MLMITLCGYTLSRCSVPHIFPQRTRLGLAASLSESFGLGVRRSLMSRITSGRNRPLPSFRYQYVTVTDTPGRCFLAQRDK